MKYRQIRDHPFCTLGLNGPVPSAHRKELIMYGGGNIASVAYRPRISFSAMRLFLFSLKMKYQNRISKKKNEKRDQIRLKTAWSTVYIPTS
jgi:hypothetical protein